jgi:hypothetical protein
MFFLGPCRGVVSADPNLQGAVVEIDLDEVSDDTASYCADAACQITGRRKDTVEHVNPKLRHDQAASELGGPGTPSHGWRQSRAVNEEDMIEGWVK